LVDEGGKAKMSKPFKLTEADITAIRSAEERFGSVEIRACVRDLFVLGLYLHLTGKEHAGAKACSLVLRTLGLSPARSRRIMRNIDGNEYSLFIAFQAHAEFNALIETRQREEGGSV
jgi:hypothetical protein